MIVLDLPFPVSTNALWRATGRRVIRSRQYCAWQQQADAVVAYTGGLRGVARIEGRFTATIALDVHERRRGSDLDNRIKAVLDYAQRVELIRDDSDLDRLLVHWGDAPHGCRLTLEPVIGPPSASGGRDGWPIIQGG